jgi:hypothetical protein
MQPLKKPSDFVLSKYLKALKTQFPEIVIDQEKTDRVIAKIQEVAIETAAEFITRCILLFEIDKVTCLSIIPSEQISADESALIADSDEPKTSKPQLKFQELAVGVTQDLMKNHLFVSWIEDTTNELLSVGVISSPIQWIMKLHPEIIKIHE